MKGQRINLLLFLITSVLVIFLQYDLLQPALKVGLTPDDWGFIFWYKLLGTTPLSRIVEVWIERGPHTTIPLYYTGIIHSIVGFNYQNLQLVSIFFKILATLVLFPLILVIFKNRPLAFFTTILFAISYPATGPLETAVEPSEYLGMFSMGLFLMVYYHVVKKHLLNWKWLILATLMFTITILLSVMRTYPLLLMIPAIEIYLWIQKPALYALKTSFLRLFFLYLPFFLIYIYRPNVIVNYITIIPPVILKVFEGNWHLALVPLQGIGYTFPFSAHWKIFGLLSMESFKDYLFFVMGGPTVIFGLVILFLSLATSSKPWKFFIMAFGINFILEILVFFIATHSLLLPLESRMIFDTSRIYSTLFGLFILVLAFTYWFEWQGQDKKNDFLLAIWIGSATAFLFVLLTWMLAIINLGFGGAQDHYLMIPTAAVSVSIAALLVIIFKKAMSIRSISLKAVGMLLIVFAIIGFYLLNRDLIYAYFKNAKANGRAAEGQILLQSKFKEKIKDLNLSQPTLFYFDASEIPSEDNPFYMEGLLSSLPFFLHLEKNNLADGCFEVFVDTRQKLSQLIKEDTKKGFVYRGLCVESGKGSYRDIFYNPENFYAFKLKNRDFYDIREEVLKELRF